MRSVHGRDTTGTRRDMTGPLIDSAAVYAPGSHTDPGPGVAAAALSNLSRCGKVAWPAIADRAHDLYCDWLPTGHQCPCNHYPDPATMAQEWARAYMTAITAAYPLRYVLGADQARHLDELEDEAYAINDYIDAIAADVAAIAALTDTPPILVDRDEAAAFGVGVVNHKPPHDEGDPSEDVTAQGDAGGDSAASSPHGADSREVGPVTSEWPPARMKGGAGESSADPAPSGPSMSRLHAWLAGRR